MTARGLTTALHVKEQDNDANTLDLAATCTLVSQIGAPIAQPAIVDVAIAASMFDRVRRRSDELVHAELSKFDCLRDELVAGSIALF